MNPAGAALYEDVVHQDCKIRGLEEEEILPGRGFEPGVVEDADGFNEQARLDGHSRANREPPEDIETGAAITLQKREDEMINTRRTKQYRIGQHTKRR